MEEAFLALHGQLSVLVHKHVLPAQARVFLAATFQVMCTYHQEVDNMVVSQTIMPAQVIPNIWGVCQGIIEGLSLLGPLTCPASWPAHLVEWVDEEPAKTATLVPPTTPVKPNTPVKSDKKNHLPDCLSRSHPSPNRFLTTGRILKEREKMSSPRGGKRRNDITKSAVLPFYLWLSMKSWFPLSHPKPLQAGYLNHPATPPSLLPLLPRLEKTGVRSEDLVPTHSIPQMMTRCPIGRGSQKPRAGNRTTSLWT